MIKSLATSLVLLAALTSPGHAQKVKKQNIQAVEGLQFEPVRISMRKGERLELKFENTDPNDQPHNIVIIEPGSLKAIQEASMKVGADAIEKHYVPDHKAVLASSKLVQADKTETISFQPKSKGVYYYICTFPGHAQMMYGAIYVDQRPPRNLADDKNIPEFRRNLEMSKLLMSLEVPRPSVRRAFLPEAGPAAIAVALPGAMNFCWDAGNCRLRYAWTGGFVDSRAMYNSNGSRFTEILGQKFWSSGGDENTFTLKTDNAKARPDFKGYRLIEGNPEFLYTFDGMEVGERLTSEKGLLHWHFRISNASRPVRIFAPGKVSSRTGKRDGDYWVVDAKSAKKFTLTLTPKK
ncbi:MAG: plastocyanin/azurin family copper-binding protein [Akkermansiaceae bacterium]|jgi:azurin